MENEQLLIIEEAWKEYEENPDNTTSLAVILQFYLGVRPGELVALKESDVSRDHIHIQHMETSCYTEGPDGKFRKHLEKLWNIQRQMPVTGKFL